MPTTPEKRAAFRSMHQDGFFILPNAWDVGSAVRLAALGFPAIASTSAGAAWAAGRADGELSRDEVLAHLRLLVGATDLPVNADFENGFADDPGELAANVALAVDTGVAAVSVEDWSGSAIYDRALASERIAAARSAIDATDGAVMLIGRHENFRVGTHAAEDPVGRAVAYAEAGADCLFVPFIVDLGMLAELVAAVAPKPVSVAVHKFDDGIRELAKIGVRRVSTGGSLALAALKGFDAAARTLRSFQP